LKEFEKLKKPGYFEQDTMANNIKKDDNNDRLLSMSNYTDFLLEQQK